MPTPVLKAQKFTSEALGPRSVRVQCSSATLDRTGEIVVQSGIKFAATVPVLFGHDTQLPVGRATPRLAGGNLVADVEFAPEGVSVRADEICGLVKAGIIDPVSIGFDPIQAVPMDPARPRGPQRYLSCELLELSFVTVPANRDAVVVARALDRDDARERRDTRELIERTEHRARKLDGLAMDRETFLRRLEAIHLEQRGMAETSGGRRRLIGTMEHWF